MPTQIQWRRGNTAQTAAFTGAIAEVTVDTDKKTLIVHDGVTPGGYALAKEASQQDALAFDTANAAFAKANNEAGVNATQNTNITNAQNTATAAFIRANNSLNANTGGQISGNLLPTTTNTYYLGSDANRWHSLYVGPGSIDLGGLVLSNQNGTLAVSVGGQSPTQISGSDQVARDTANGAFASANTKVSKSGDTMTGDLKFGGGGGILNLPTNQIAITANVDTDVSGFIAQATGVSTVYANTDVIIQANTGGATFSQWTFSTDGSLEFPAGYILPNTIGAPGQILIAGGQGSVSWADLPGDEIDPYARNHANAAFASANNVAPQIEPAFTTANGAFAKANNEAGVNATQNTNITNAQNKADAGFIHANASFNAANNVFPQIQPSFNTANAAFIRANNSLSANNGGTITGDVSITGNLSVLGNTFTVSATTIVANDTVIVLGNGNYTSDLLDIGISAHYNDGVNAHTGLIRDHATKEWQLFEGYTGEIGANNDVIITDPSFKRATLNANLKSQSITLNDQNLQTYIDGAYNTANASFASANNIDGINTTQNNSITAAFAAANTADVKGTSAGIYANGAFAAANTADDKGTSAGIYANGAFKAANSNYTNAVTKLNVTNSGASAFLIDQYSGNNPTIYVRAGETIAFNLNVTGHPFMIRVSSGGSNYDTGLTHVDLNGTVNTGSNAQGKETGVLYWKVPFDLVGLTYVYQCSVHGGMVGNIVIEQPTVLAFNHANAAFTYANTLNPSDTFARNQANAAFLTANTANNTANLAYANSYFPFGRFRIFNVNLPGGYYYLRERRDPSQNAPTIVVTAGKTFAFELQDLVGMSAALRTRPNYFGDSSFVANVTHISTTGVVTKNVTTYHTSGTLYWDIPLGLSGNSTIVLSDPVYNASPVFLRINDESKADYAATTANAAATSTFAGAAYAHANAAFTVANTATSAGSYANSAFLVANAAFSAVSQSYNVANSSIVSTKLWSWGRNDFYKLGLGNAYSAVSTIYSPIQVGTSKDWKKITGGSTSTAGLKTDGSIWVWGYVNGILGDSSATSSATSPIQAAGGFNWKDVECGTAGAVIYAIKTNGTLWAWGNNTYGQLGHGDVIARSSPVQVGSATNWNKISFGVLGAYVAAAIKDDGTLWIWGDLTGGQAGDSLSPLSYYRSAPVQVGSAANWKEVNCKGGGIRAIKTDGTLWAWGNNTYGQLGDGTAVSKSSPVQVGSSTNWSKVDHGLEHTMALKTDGTLWTWGRNNQAYQLGDGTLVSRSSPVQTSAGGTNWKSISAGDYHSAAIKTDDSLWLWGFGGFYQLQQHFDTGNQADPKSPVTYPLFNHKQVYAHSGATFAIVFEYNS